MNSSELTIWEDPYYPDKTIKINLPLTSSIDLDEVCEDLGIPNYIDLQYFPMERAVVTLWAAKHAPELPITYPNEVRKKPFKKPIKIALIGGAAFKIHCPSANMGGAFERELNDVDFVASRKDYKELKDLFLLMGDIAGSRYFHYITPHDNRFNALNAEWRMLVHTFDGFQEDGTPVIGVMDVLMNQIRMRHNIDVKKDLEHPGENLYTITLENLLLSKCQFIMEISDEDAEELKRQGDEYRLIDYPKYSEGKKILGMESKDMKDVSSLLLDHSIGEEPGSLNLKLIEKKCKKDKKCGQTVRLNLENTYANIERVPKEVDLGDGLTTIKERLERVLEGIPEASKKWSPPWWNTDVVTPKIIK